MKTQSFIFNWRNQFLSTLSIESALHSCIDHVHVINSDENNFKPYWHNIGESSYFTSQFLKALELHDGESVFFHVQGDTSYSNWPQLIKDAGHYMSKYNVGIYYPKVKNVEWQSDELVELKLLNSQDENIKYVAAGDQTVWFIHPQIINYIKNAGLHKTFDSNKVGWGWDFVVSISSYLLGMGAIRDSNHIVEHSASRTYDNTLADKGWRDTFSRLPAEMQYYINLIYKKENLDPIAKMLPPNKTHRKASGNL